MPHQDDLDRPMNPPQSVVRPAVRRTALFTYMGGLVALFAIVGVALLFWSGRDDGYGSEQTYGGGDEPSALGTAGERTPREASPGGFDPDPDHGDTRDEIEFRGGDAQRVNLENVAVERADGDTFWVKSGNDTIAVVSAGGTPTVRAGQRVDITGTYEDAGGARRIRASRIDIK